MRNLILALIGIVSYCIIVIPGWFLFVPREQETPEPPSAVSETPLEEPGQEPPPK